MEEVVDDTVLQTVRLAEPEECVVLYATLPQALTGLVTFKRKVVDCL